MKRREFLKGLAGGAIAAPAALSAAAGCSGRPSANAVRYAADVPVCGDYDVAVFGAGPAGIGAAISAARLGKRTVLVEKYNVPGGVSSWASTPLFFRFADHDSKPTRQIVKGVADEIVRLLDRQGCAGLFRDGGNEELHPGRIGDKPLFAKVFAPQEPLRIVYYDLLEKAGVDLLFMAHLAGVVREGRYVTAAIVDCLEGPRAIRAKVMVDATGDAHLVHRAGGATVQADPYGTMHKSVFFEVAGVRPHDAAANKRRYAAMRKEGTLPEMVWQHMSYVHFPEPDHYQIPVAYAVGDNCSSKDMTRMDAELRRTNAAVLRAYRENLDGFRDAYWVNSAWQVCSRDGRHVVGRRTLTVDMLKRGGRTADGVVPVVRKWGLMHSPRQQEGFAAKVDTGYLDGTVQIPYGALVPRDLDNVLVAGRALSAEVAATGATRMMPTCFATGQVAGTAAALAVDRRLADVGAVPYVELRGRLEAQGHVVE